MTASGYPFIELSYACSDVVAHERFWCDLFDAQVIFRGTIMGEPFSRVVACGVSLVFREDPDFVAPAGAGEERAWRNRIGLRVDDLDASVAALEAKGARFVLTPEQVRAYQRATGDDGTKMVCSTYIAPPLTAERIADGEFAHEVAILVGPDNVWVELNQIKEPADTRWYPGS